MKTYQNQSDTLSLLLVNDTYDRFVIGKTDANNVLDINRCYYPIGRNKTRSGSVVEMMYQSLSTKKTDKEFNEYLLKSGFMSQLPDLASYNDDPQDQPVTIKGEALSKTIIRDRR